MKNNKLQEIWKSAGTASSRKSKDELNLLLTSKARQIAGRFTFDITLAIAICAIVLAWVGITSIERRDDMAFVVINLLLMFMVAAAMLSYLKAWFRLRRVDPGRPLKSWLELRIDILSKALRGRFSRLYPISLPVLSILLLLSIHIYFENKPFAEVMHSGETIAAFTAGFLAITIVSFAFAIKVRKKQLHDLDYLKDLHARLCENH